MRKFKAILALAILLAVGGCVRMHSDLDIEKDGSGTFTMTYSMSKEVAGAIKELEAMPGSGGDQDAPTLDDFSREKITELASKYDVKVEDFERTTTAGRETISFTLAFKCIADLSGVIQGTTDDNGGGMAIFKTADGNYVLEAVTAPEPIAPDDDAGVQVDARDTPVDPAQMSPEDMQRSMEIMGKLMGSLSELDIRMAVTVPGEVISSNAPSVEDRTSIWAINADNMMSAGNDMQPQIVFSGKGLKIKGAEEQR